MAAKKKEGMGYQLKAAPAKAEDPPAKKSASIPPEELKGEDLDKAVKRADVEGRSQMTADEKREAVAEVAPSRAKPDSRSKSRREADDAKAKAAAAAEKAAEKKADRIADLPDVEEVVVEIDDADAIVMLDDDWFRLSPAQVHYLAKTLTHASSDLHIHSNA